MSKQYKNKTCAYCGCPGISELGEHIFARAFFLPRHRPGLPQVPSCMKCNEVKSRSETYLTHALPLAGRHRDAVENIDTLLQKRRSHNSSIERGLVSSRRLMWVRNSSGLVVQDGVYQINANMLREWASFVARGLTLHHWKVAIGADHLVTVNVAMPRGVGLLEDFLEYGADPKSLISCDLGEGTMRYRGGRDERLMVWLIQPYGGMPIGGVGVDLVTTTLSIVLRTKVVSEELQRQVRWQGSLIIRP